MKKKKVPSQQKPMTPEMIQIANERLFEYMREQKFESIEEINEFLGENVNGKKIDKLVPSKPGRKSKGEKSDELIYKAYESDARTGIKLVKKALEIDPENIKALNYLAENEYHINKACDLYQKAVTLGEKQLGERYFRENKGHFWWLNETRPYMTAKRGVAECLKSLGRNGEAIKILQEMLDLNPGDNQGVRYMLSGLLLRTRKLHEYCFLYKKFQDEDSAFWLYNHAMYLFIKDGPSIAANRALREAYNSNKYVIKIMAGKKKVTSDPPGFYSPGDENEAVYYLFDNLKLWTETHGAFEWAINFHEILSKMK